MCLYYAILNIFFQLVHPGLQVKNGQERACWSVMLFIFVPELHPEMFLCLKKASNIRLSTWFCSFFQVECLETLNSIVELEGTITN